jgi:hypothetical protein
MLWPNGSTVEPRLSGDESEADFGPRTTGKGFHDGVDYGNYFRVVRSIEAGRVSRVQPWNGRSSMQHGNRVWVDHGDFESSYSHLARIDVREGETVSAGQSLGTMGATGYVTGVHLHLEIRVSGVLIDPRPFIRARIGGTAAGGGGSLFEPVEDDMYDDQAKKDAADRHAEAMWELACLRPIKLYALVDESGAGGWLWVGPSGKWWATGQDMGAYVILADAQKLSQPRPIRAMLQAEFDYLTKQFLPSLNLSDSEEEMDRIMQLDPVTVSEIVAGIGDRPAVLTVAQLDAIATAAADAAQAGGAQGARDAIKGITLVVGS